MDPHRRGVHGTCSTERCRGDTRNQEPCHAVAESSAWWCLVPDLRGSRGKAYKRNRVHAYMRDTQSNPQEMQVKAVGQEAKARARKASVAKFHLTGWVEFRVGCVLGRGERRELLSSHALFFRSDQYRGEVWLNALECGCGGGLGLACLKEGGRARRGRARREQCVSV